MSVPFEIGDVVASVSIGIKPAFVGIVIAVHRNWIDDFYYDVIDSDGFIWCREPDDIWPASSAALERAA